MTFSLFRKLRGGGINKLLLIAICVLVSGSILLTGIYLIYLTGVINTRVMRTYMYGQTGNATRDVANLADMQPRHASSGMFTLKQEKSNDAEQRIANNCPDDGSRWSFSCTVDCPRWENPTDSNNNNTRDAQLLPVCQGTSVAVHVTSRHGQNIPAFPFNDSCLRLAVHDHCYDGLIVPNLVHYVWFGKREMGFYHFLSFWSAHKVLKPCFIFVHSNYLPFGRYWNFLLKHVPNVIHVNRSQPLDIYGTKINFVEHSADLARMEAVRDFGGIYMDVDVIVLRTFEPLRRYNFTMSRAFNFNLANAVLVSARNATFLKFWFDAYKEYNPKSWGNHSTIVPWKLSKQHGEHIHIEEFTFSKPDAGKAKAWIYRGNFNWETNYAMHLFIRQNKTVHDFIDIRTLNTTVGSVARFTLFENKELCNV